VADGAQVPETIAERVAARYPEMSGRLRAAADYVVAHMWDVSTRSLRAVSEESGLSPASFSRLARALGFESYDEMKALVRRTLEQRATPFSERAERLQLDGGGAAVPTLVRQSAACIDNISSLVDDIAPERLEAIVERLDAARRVVLFGALGSAGIIEHFAYVAGYFVDNWSVADSGAEALGAALARIGPEDVFLVLTKTPYARRAVAAARQARARGAHVIVLTDAPGCPALAHAHTWLIVPTDSPYFFSSYAATIVLVETIVSMLLQRRGQPARDAIKEVEAANADLSEFGADDAAPRT